MDDTDLDTFIAVAEASSFSRAAERLNLTQPAVTKRIQRLEDSLGTRLFDRIGKRVELTEGGAMGKLVGVLRSTNTVDTAPASAPGGHAYTGAEHSDPHAATVIAKAPVSVAPKF